MAAEYDHITDLFVHQLQDLYDAERRQAETLPDWAEEADSEDLRAHFGACAAESTKQAERLEEVFDLLGLQPRTETCHAMKGLLKEAKEALTAKGSDAVTDLALIAAAQRVEHYEIAGYGSARTMATILNHDKVAHLLQESLGEEARSDQRMTDLAHQLYAAAA